MIKLHMGETGSLKTRIQPEEVKVIVDKIRASGGEPFLFDTTTLYRRERYTKQKYLKFAKENGFADFEVVIGNDDDVKHVNGYGILNELLNADAMVVLSHAKGHVFTQYAGAIKNLGMGCVNKDGKRKIHMVSKPKWDKSKCTQCGACIKACEDGFVQLDGGEITIDLRDCSGCGACVNACPTGAMWREQGSVEASFEKFNEAAKAVLDEFRNAGKPVFYINVLKNITRYCDCAVDVGKIVCPDIGYLTGDSALKIDQESIKLIKEKSPNALDWKTIGLFMEIAEKYF